MSQPKSNEGHVAYSPEINAVRAVLVKYLNEYPADLLADLAQLLTEQKDEAAETAFKSAIKICELGNIKPPKSNEGWKVKVRDWWYELEEECSGMMHSQPELRRAILEDIIKEALAQKDKEVADREKYVPRFKGINIFSGEEVEGAGCYTSEKGTAYILEDNKGEEPTFTPVKEINYDWYTPKN